MAPPRAPWRAVHDPRTGEIIGWSVWNGRGDLLPPRPSKTAVSPDADPDEHHGRRNGERPPEPCVCRRCGEPCHECRCGPSMRDRKRLQQRQADERRRGKPERKVYMADRRRALLAGRCITCTERPGDG